jgi:hypothetical protein
MSRLPLYPNPQTPAHWRALINAIDFNLGLVETQVADLDDAVFYDTGVAPGAVTAGQAMASSGAGTIVKAQANALSTSRVVGFVRETTAGAGVAEIQSVGIIPITGVVANTRYFLSAVTSGLIVSTPDAVAGQFLVPIGWGVTTDRLLFVPHTPILI